MVAGLLQEMLRCEVEDLQTAPDTRRMSEGVLGTTENERLDSQRALSVLRHPDVDGVHVFRHRHLLDVFLDIACGDALC